MIDHEDSLTLLALAREGDVNALNQLITRYRPRLSRWAHGRLPGYARDLSDTDDLVQETLLKTITNLSTFVPQTEGSLLAYLRQAVSNRIRDQIRRARVRPTVAALEENVSDGLTSPLESLIETERLVRYEAALQALEAPLREAIIARFEMGYSFAEVAGLLGKSSPDAARKYVKRALTTLSRQLQVADDDRD